MTVKSKHILIVDDQANMRRILKNLLKQLGFDQVEEAEGGAVALSTLETKDFSLIIADWTMESVPGLELLKQIRGHDKFGKMPFIMVASQTKPEHVLAAKELGVNGYIIKPFNAETLKAKLAVVFGPF